MSLTAAQIEYIVYRGSWRIDADLRQTRNDSKSVYGDPVTLAGQGYEDMNKVVHRMTDGVAYGGASTAIYRMDFGIEGAVWVPVDVHDMWALKGTWIATWGSVNKIPNAERIPQAEQIRITEVRT